jgi:hypothetical protein
MKPPDMERGRPARNGLHHRTPAATIPDSTIHARDYIARGWPMFVLSPSKIPTANCGRCKDQHTTAAQMEACDCLTCHGFYAATLDPDRIMEMVRQQPRGLLVIRTGSPSGTVVIDVDQRTGGLPTMRRLAAEGRLPSTVLQRTGGGGYHLVYGHPGGRIHGGSGKGGPGIDVQADGKYIVVAPSVHPHTRKPYRWLVPFTGPLTPLPQSWTDLLREPARPAPLPRPAPVARPGDYGGAALAGEAARVATAAAGARNAQLNASAFALGRLVATGVLTSGEVTEVLMAAAEDCGLAAEDGPAACERTIRSALRARGAA